MFCFPPNLKMSITDKMSVFIFGPHLFFLTFQSLVIASLLGKLLMKEEKINRERDVIKHISTICIFIELCINIA